MDAPSRFDPNDDTPIRDNREVVAALNAAITKAEDSARTEEIRARVEKDLDVWARRLACYNGADRQEVEKRQAWFRSELEQFTTAELTALRDEVERLKGALKAATRCPTCEGTGEMTVECASCCYGEIPNPAGSVCTCSKETCAQCDGRGWATADGTGEELVAAALSPSPAQQEQP